ncbi:acyltransferase family protein [Pseudarthrobacter niigatensis]|uniref:Membrane protein YcfT n=1 Tax=Pseudarthrobacter niigatensis TaxID=369935 RepID=A0AAJ1SWG2_9MICC|nr:acyltransferase family protein [Pseudarthrobacter niigatensis]MDQ0145986.1 putative membrane protein YcfT [Pseudarthrobacter niigatensis]MDQ0266286.1 putative membrane protein YcfT [Pseudarthrobacter niigatensis]
MGWVDAAKGISIFLVVMVHATDWTGYVGVEPTPLIEAFNGAAVGVRMPLFFLMSGLFAGKWIAVPWKALVNGKLALLVWVFLLWQPVMFAYKYLAGLMLPGQEDSSLMAHLVRMVASPVRPNAELWFLWALVVFFVGAKLLQKVPAWVILVASAGLSLGWSAIAQPALGENMLRLLGPGLGAFPMYFVFFMAGILLKGQVIAAVSRVSWIAGLAGFTAWLVVNRLLEASGGFFGRLFVIQILGAVGGLLAAVVLQHVQPLRRLGTLTLPVYVSHTFFVVLMACAIELLDLEITGHFEAATPWFIAVVAVLLGLGLHRVAASSFLFNNPQWFQSWSRGRHLVGARHSS